MAPVSRRAVLAASTASLLAQAPAGRNAIVIDPKPIFDISPHFYMQFMEPLGATDSSVEASWDYDINDWRADFVAITRDLAPQTMRWGGLFSRYYRWREGIGPAAKRPTMRNYQWGGIESNRVGIHEFAGFCKAVGADPLLCVNFQGDGFQTYRNKPEGDRTGGPEEAADWVSYCNDPSHAERRRNGAPEPFNVKLWQLGNETSYNRGGFTLAESIRATIAFAEAMKKRDSTVRLIGWGDHGETPAGRGLWAPELVKRAGEHIDLVAMHMMGQSPTRPDTILRGYEYQKDPARAWEELLDLAARVHTRLTEMEQGLAAAGSKHGIAVTEGHLSLQPHNANPILTEWLSAAYHARSMNTYLRHGAKVRICTGADFAGNRWTVNAVTLQTPRGISYLQPIGAIMRLFRRYHGTHGAAVPGAPPALDVAASLGIDAVILHVLNTDFKSPVFTQFHIPGRRITSGTVHQIAPDAPRAYVDIQHPKTFDSVERTLSVRPNAPVGWTFPARSVSAVILSTQKENQA